MYFWFCADYFEQSHDTGSTSGSDIENITTSFSSFSLPLDNTLSDKEDSTSYRIPSFSFPSFSSSYSSSHSSSSFSHFPPLSAPSSTPKPKERKLFPKPPKNNTIPTLTTPYYLLYETAAGCGLFKLQENLEIEEAEYYIQTFPFLQQILTLEAFDSFPSSKDAAVFMATMNDGIS